METNTAISLADPDQQLAGIGTRKQCTQSTWRLFEAFVYLLPELQFARTPQTSYVAHERVVMLGIVRDGESLKRKIAVEDEMKILDSVDSPACIIDADKSGYQHSGAVVHQR